MSDATPAPPTPGQWSSALCACRAERIICWTTLCCPCVAYPQLVERVFARAGSCAVLGVVHCILCVTMLLLGLYATIITFSRIVYFTSDSRVPDHEAWEYIGRGFPAEFVASYVGAGLSACTRARAFPPACSPTRSSYSPYDRGLLPRRTASFVHLPPCAS
jgi:hypothetical protein